MTEYTAASTTLSQVLTVLGITLGTVVTVCLAYYIIKVIAHWRIFSKAGEPGWKSLIPIYNNYISYKIAWHPAFFWIGIAATFFSSVLYTYGVDNENSIFLAVSSVLMIAAALISLIQVYKLARAFGHGVPFTLGLLFLNPIFILILGLGGSKYRGRD